MNKVQAARNSLMVKDDSLIHFMSLSQRKVLEIALAGEEAEFFADLVLGVKKTILDMPKTYETDGRGGDAVVHLHYFRGSVDAWITEKDATNPEDAHPGRQLQAFGKVDIGYGAELGYVSIYELIGNNVELDLSWTPKQLKDIK